MDIRPLLATDAPAIHQNLLGDPGGGSLVSLQRRVHAGGVRGDGDEEGRSSDRPSLRLVAGWEGETCVGWSVAQYCIVDGISEVEIGWTVARSYWRRGIASRLGGHAPTEVMSLGLRSVVAYTREDNVASRGVMTKLRDELRKEF